MNLVPAFKESIFNNPITDISTDLLEVGIDSVLEDGLLKEVPIIKTIIKATQVACDLRDRNLLKNTATFLCTLQSGEIAQENLQKYRQKLEIPGNAEKELGRVLIFLDRFIDNIKSKLLARIYSQYINQAFDWKTFCELSDVLDRLIIEDISYIQENVEKLIGGCTFDILEVPYNMKRIESVGLVSIGGNYVRFGEYIWQARKVRIEPTENGITMFETISKL